MESQAFGWCGILKWLVRDLQHGLPRLNRFAVIIRRCRIAGPHIQPFDKRIIVDGTVYHDCGNIKALSNFYLRKFFENIWMPCSFVLLLLTINAVHEGAEQLLDLFSQVADL